MKRELPALLRDDPDLRRYVLELTRGEYADRQQTEDRFDRILEELRQDREAQERKWAKQDRKWEEQDRKWEEQDRRWEKQDRKWKQAQEENRREWEEQNRKWWEAQAENKRRWEEQDRKWEESRAEFQQVHQEIMALAERHDRHIGALGARWGLQSEATFRNALAGILEKNFDIQVLNVNEYDDQGEVFGRPDQVELDVIIKNGLLLICELKSSIDKGGMYLFERKARFYERRHNRKADRLIVISPMIDEKAKQLAEKLGIEIYSDSLEVKDI
nr:DUF3782 domain-containing protein [Candidatus Thiosymbion oneisti]